MFFSNLLSIILGEGKLNWRFQNSLVGTGSWFGIVGSLLTAEMQMGGVATSSLETVKALHLVHAMCISTT